jgi:hypothetical protein
MAKADVDANAPTANIATALNRNNLIRDMCSTLPFVAFIYSLLPVSGTQRFWVASETIAAEHVAAPDRRWPRRTCSIPSERGPARNLSYCGAWSLFVVTSVTPPPQRGSDDPADVTALIVVVGLVESSGYGECLA